MKRSVAVTMASMVVLLILSLMLYSCGRGSKGSGSSGVYITGDDTSDSSITGNDTSGSDTSGDSTSDLSATGDTTSIGSGGISGFEQWLNIGTGIFSEVNTTINTIQLVNSETGETCSLLNLPATLNLADLANTMQLESVEGCPAGSYDRIQIQFVDTFELVSGQTGIPSSCQLVDYKKTGSSAQPNILFCNSGICTININGAVDVLANESNKTGLNFHFKEFIVSDLGTPACTVTMKVSPLNNSKIKSLNRLESVKGLVSNLNTATGAFDLARGNKTFSVNYSGIHAGNQPGLDAMLQQAQENGLRVRVMSPDIDLTSGSITASKISIKIEGTASIFE